MSIWLHTESQFFEVFDIFFMLLCTASMIPLLRMFTIFVLYVCCLHGCVGEFIAIFRRHLKDCVGIKWNGSCEELGHCKLIPLLRMFAISVLCMCVLAPWLCWSVCAWCYVHPEHTVPGELSKYRDKRPAADDDDDEPDKAYLHFMHLYLYI